MRTQVFQHFSQHPPKQRSLEKDEKGAGEEKKTSRKIGRVKNRWTAEIVNGKECQEAPHGGIKREKDCGLEREEQTSPNQVFCFLLSLAESEMERKQEKASNLPFFPPLFFFLEICESWDRFGIGVKFHRRSSAFPSIIGFRHCGTGSAG